MAQSHDASVARAVFIAALLRVEPGAPDISRDNATLFARSVLRTCNICTAFNIKVAKSFIISYILGSSLRTSALSKYLLTLSKSFAPRDAESRVDTTKSGDENEGLGKIIDGKVQQPPEPAFKRLHLLYLIHDVLMHYHSHRRFSGVQGSSEAIDQLRPDVSKLCELAVCGCGGDTKTTSTCQLVLELISFWEKSGLFGTSHTEQMRDAVRSADGKDWDVVLDKVARADENGHSNLQDEATKWILPTHHGVLSDPTAPWHELPAANGLYLKRTKGYPMLAGALPPGGLPVQGAGREADPQLKKDVGALYEDVLRCFDKYTPAEEVQDVDALGNIVWKDPERPTTNYWGFTLDGIDKRKELAAHFSRNTVGYNGYGQIDQSRHQLDDAVERARAFAAERGRGMGRGMGRGRGFAGGNGFRGGRPARW